MASHKNKSTPNQTSHNWISYEEFKHAKSWPLGFTTSQVQFFEDMTKGHRPFLQRFSNIPLTVSKSCQFNSCDDEFIFFKIRKASKIPKLIRKTQQSFSTKSNLKGDSEKDKSLTLKRELSYSKLKQVRFKDKKRISKPLRNDSTETKISKPKSKFKNVTRSVNTNGNFENVLTASDALTLRTKMQTQNWVFPDDLHLLIKVLRNIILQLDVKEPKLESSELRLLFFLEFDSQSNNTPLSKIKDRLYTHFLNHSYKHSTETHSDWNEEPSTLNNLSIEENENNDKVNHKGDKPLNMNRESRVLLKVFEMDANDNSVSTTVTKSVSLQSEHSSKITFDQFQMMLEYAWKLFILRVAKMLDVSNLNHIRKEALYSALRTVTSYALTSIQSSNPLSNCVSTVKNASGNKNTSEKISLSNESKINNSECTIDENSILSIKCSKSKSDKDTDRRLSSNTFIKLFSKDLESKSASCCIEDICNSNPFWNETNARTVVCTKISNVSPNQKRTSSCVEDICGKNPICKEKNFKNIFSSKNSQKVSSESENRLKQEAPALIKSQPVPFKYSTGEYFRRNFVKAYSTNKKQSKFLMGSTLRPLNDDDFFMSSTHEPLADRWSIEESIQESHGSDRSNYILSPASVRAVTQEKISDIEKKSGVFYEILSYVYDKIVSRKSSNEIDVEAPPNSSATSKDSVSCTQLIEKIVLKTAHKEDAIEVEKEIKSFYHDLLHSDENFPPKSDKSIAMSQVKLKNNRKNPFEDEDDVQIKECDKKNVVKVVKQPDEKRKLENEQKNVLQEAFVKNKSEKCICKHKSESLGKTSESQINCPSISSQATASSDLSMPQLIKNIQRILPEYNLEENDINVFNDNLKFKKLSISVSQNTSFTVFNKFCEDKYVDVKRETVTEQKLKEVLKVVLKEIESEKKKKRLVNQKISLATSTNGLVLQTKKSKTTQSSNTQVCENLNVTIEVCDKTKRRINKCTKIDSMSIENTKPSSPFTKIPQKKYIVHQAPKIEMIRMNTKTTPLETKSILNRIIFNGRTWEDCHRSTMSTADKLSRLKLSQFALILNLLTVQKRNYPQDTTSILTILSETELNNDMINFASKDYRVIPDKVCGQTRNFLSTTDCSENISEIYTNEKLDKKQLNVARPSTTTKLKRELSKVFFHFEIEDKKKPCVDFGDNEGFLNCEYSHGCQSLQRRPRKKLRRLGNVHTSKLQKLSKHWFSSSGTIPQSLVNDDFDYFYETVPECSGVQVDDVGSDTTYNAFDSLRQDDYKPKLVQYPVMLAKEHTNKSENKNKHVTWNLQPHLPY